MYVSIPIPGSMLQTNFIQVVLVQVASSSAPDLTDLETQITKIAMRINSKYSTLTHQPLVLLKQDISFAQFLALMSVAEIFIITSLREGMNLSGHDFVVCQDGTSGVPQKYGSLILSEFTGSASIWSGHELLVNPWDYVQCADAINRALLMSAEDKEKNWRFLSGRMAKHTASMWCDTYLKALRQAYEMQSSREVPTTNPVRKEIRTASTANGRRSLSDLEHATAVAASKPVQRPMSRVSAALGS